MAPQTRSQTRQHKVETMEKTHNNTNNCSWSDRFNWSWLWYLMVMVMLSINVWVAVELVNSLNYINYTNYINYIKQIWFHYTN
jgi:hypothetical protein